MTALSASPRRTDKFIEAVKEEACQRGCTELLGDPVYAYMRTDSELIQHGVILGGRIIDNKSAGPKEPRKLIEIAFLGNEANKLRFLKYNYKKVERTFGK